MKSKIRIVSVLLSALLGCALAVGAVGCLASGFDIAVSGAWIIGAVALLCAALGALGGRVRRWWIVLLILSVGGTAYLWFFGSLGLQGMALLDRITLAYEEAYGWTPTAFFSDPLFLATLEQPIGWLMALFSIWLSFMIAKAANPMIVIALSALPVIPCLVATHTAPGGGWAFLWIAAAVTLLLAVSGCRKRSAPRLKRTALTAVAVMAATALLLTAVPPDGEYDQKHEWRDHILHRLGLHSGSEDNDHTAFSRAPVEVLEEAGYPRGTQMVMKLLASKETVAYVREQDYNLYDGARWGSDPDRSFEPQWHGDADWYLSVQTSVAYSRKMVPYYPTTRVRGEGGNVRNMRRDTEYTWAVNELDDNWKEQLRESARNNNYTAWSQLDDWYSGNVFLYEDEFASIPSLEAETDLYYANPYEPLVYGYEDYLGLPAMTQLWADGVVSSLVSDDMIYTDKADAIVAYVQSQAEYVDHTYSAPDDGEDFAQWFLEDYRKGCCVHFATATAVLLRAAGVPTRYVTGYARELPRTTWTAVLETHAHAWVEYYEPLMGQWIRLETTPPGAIGIGVEEEETTTTDELTASTTMPHDDDTTTTTAPATVSEDSHPLTDLPWKTIALATVGVVTVIGGVMLQRVWRLRARRRRRQRAAPNDRARLMWHEAQRLSKALKESPPDELYALAQKAAFSRDVLTDAELSVLEAYLTACTVRLKTRPFPRRVWHRLVLVLY